MMTSICFIRCNFADSIDDAPDVCYISNAYPLTKWTHDIEFAKFWQTHDDCEAKRIAAQCQQEFYYDGLYFEIVTFNEQEQQPD